MSRRLPTRHRRFERSRDLYRSLGDERGAVNLQTRLAINVAYFGDLDDARGAVDRLVPLVRTLELLRLEAELTAARAVIARRDGRLEDAYRLEAESGAQAAAIGFAWWESNSLTNRAELALELDRPDDVEANGRQALKLSRTIDDRLATLWVLVCLSRLAARRGDLVRAGWLWGVVEGEVAGRAPPQLASLEELAESLVAITDDAFLAAAARGAQDDLGDAVALILGEDDGQTVP